MQIPLCKLGYDRYSFGVHDMGYSQRDLHMRPRPALLEWRLPSELPTSRTIMVSGLEISLLTAICKNADDINQGSQMLVSTL